MSKYHIFYRLKNDNNTLLMGSSSGFGRFDGWKYLDSTESKDRLHDIIKDNNFAEYRVIYGKELEWDEEYEEVTHTHTTRNLISRKPKF